MIGDLLARWRAGWPAPGKLTVHPRLTFPFEAGTEGAARLTACFGDLSRLSAIDLGCGPVETPVAKNIFEIPWRQLTSVEVFPKYLEQLKTKVAGAAEHRIVPMRIEDALSALPAKSIDVAILIDVLEHFPRGGALTLMRRLERFARRGVVIFSPLGVVPQEAIDGNELQRHRSDWKTGDFLKLGYNVEVYEAFHGHMAGTPDAAWAIKKF